MLSPSRAARTVLRLSRLSSPADGDLQSNQLTSPSCLPSHIFLLPSTHTYVDEHHERKLQALLKRCLLGRS